MSARHTHFLGLGEGPRVRLCRLLKFVGTRSWVSNVVSQFVPNLCVLGVGTCGSRILVPRDRLEPPLVSVVSGAIFTAG